MELSNMTEWLKAKIKGYDEEMTTWDRHTEEYGYCQGAKEAFEDALGWLEKN